MKNRLVSLGIGLNMFFQDFYDIGKPEFHIGKSWSWMLKEKMRFNVWLSQKLKDGTIRQYLNEVK
ncbi:hypothetical protein D3C87_664240 [compost metagenome]